MKNIRVILIEPSASGNPGSIARAMANFGAEDLVFVNPRPFDMRAAADYACGGARIIEKARVAATFEEALAGAVFVAGTTRRVRSDEPSCTASDAAGMIVPHAAAGTAALVFGREKSGLSKEEKARCHILAGIDTVDGSAGSLNISHAAAVFLYECSRACGGADIRPPADTAPLEAAFDLLLSRIPGYGEASMLQRIFASMIKRAAPNFNEVKKLTKAFGAAAARMKPDDIL